MIADSREDAETATEEMKWRGLNGPLLMTSSGAPGTIMAIEFGLYTRPAGGAWRIACASWRPRDARAHLARVQGARAVGLSGAEPRDCARARGRRRHPLCRKHDQECRAQVDLQTKNAIDATQVKISSSPRT
jgi:hypothetical protein